MERSKKVVESLSDLIETIRKMFAGDEVDVELVKDLLASYESKPDEWKQYSFFDRNKWVQMFELPDQHVDQFCINQL